MDREDAKRLAEQGWYLRRACKVFDTDQKVSEADFSYILGAVRFSPSAFGLEPWRFVVLQNQQLREGLIPYCSGARRQLPTCSHFVVLLAQKNATNIDVEQIRRANKEVGRIAGDGLAVRLDKVRAARGSEAELIDNRRAMFEWACKQCYVALAMMMHSASIIGVDSYPVEGFDRDLVEAYLEEQGVIDADEYGVACMVSFGYRMADSKDKAKHRLEEIVQWVY